jgi:hypothetical protein
MYWATFWAIFSQTHLFALVPSCSQWSYSFNGLKRTISALYPHCVCVLFHSETKRAIYCETIHSDPTHRAINLEKASK